MTPCSAGLLIDSGIHIFTLFMPHWIVPGLTVINLCDSTLNDLTFFRSSMMVYRNSVIATSELGKRPCRKWVIVHE